MDENDPAIAPSMLYAYAALMEKVPFCNGAPNLTVDLPCMLQLANDHGVPVGPVHFAIGGIGRDAEASQDRLC